MDEGRGFRKRGGPMRLRFVLLLTAAVICGFTADGRSQENSPAVTDLTMAEALSIQTSDIIDGLSQRRAVSVERFLANSGVPTERLEAVGRGELDPVALNDNSTGRRRNRRVELINRGAQP
jgi:outer membrane protein OmpA-like peptidoglycan-associated protein